MAAGENEAPGNEASSQGENSQKAGKKRGPRRKKKTKYFTGSEEQRLMKAYQDPLRVKITAIMNEIPEASAKSLEKLLPGEDYNQIIYAVQRLKFFRIIVPTKQVKRRGGTEQWYRAVSRAMIPAEVWGNVPDQAQHEISVGILRELWADIYDAMAGGTFEKPESHLSITPFVLDRRGLLEAKDVLNNALDTLLAIQEQANSRMKKNGTSDSKGVSATVGLVGFESTRDPALGIRASQTKAI